MFELIKKIMDGFVNLYHKLKCNMSCCSSTMNVRVIEYVRVGTPPSEPSSD